MFKEFKTFAMRGNVVDMAVGIVIGSAFGKIISSLVKDIIMPPVGFLLGGIDLGQLNLILREASEGQEAITLGLGIFLSTILDFIIIAFAIFMVVSNLNKLKKKEEAKVTSKKCDFCLNAIPLEAKKCGFCTSSLA